MNKSLPTLPPRRAARGKPADRSLPLKLVLLILVLLGIVALFVDISSLTRRRPKASSKVATELQDIMLGLGGERYTDASGLFSMVPPAGWQIVRRPDADPYNAVFWGPNGADMSVMATPVDYDDLPSLFKDIEKGERQPSIRTAFEAIKLQGRPAVRRTCKLHHIRVLAIDFVENRVAYHILCTAPPDLFEKYEPVLMEVIYTLRPEKPKAPTP